MVSYDGQVIQQFAQRLYGQAASIIATYSILGFFLGALLGVIAGGALIGTRDSNGPLMGAGVGGLIFLLGGLSIARQKAFALRLQAQTALCQVQIEANTRTTAVLAQRVA